MRKRNQSLEVQQTCTMHIAHTPTHLFDEEILFARTCIRLKLERRDASDFVVMSLLLLFFFSLITSASDAVLNIRFVLFFSRLNHNCNASNIM